MDFKGKAYYGFKRPSILDGSARELLKKHQTTSSSKWAVPVYGYSTSPSRGGCSGGSCKVTSVLSSVPLTTRIYNI